MWINRSRERWWHPGAAVLCLAAALVLLPAGRAAHAGPSYPLYYVLEMPPVLTGYEMDANQNKRVIYTGLLRGTLGGLAIESSSLTLHPGASAGAGGGEFTLKTAAGVVQNGLLLMTTDRRQTTVLFSGNYLGARLQFQLAGPTATFGSSTIVTKGLADTSFFGDADYIGSVTAAVAGLPPADRAQAIAAASSNPRLVSAFQSTTGSP